MRYLSIYWYYIFFDIIKEYPTPSCYWNAYGTTEISGKNMCKDLGQASQNSDFEIEKWQEPSFMNITETQFQLQRKRQVIWQYSTCLCAKKVHLEKGKCYHYLKLFAKGLSFHLLLWTYSKGEHYLVYANSKQCEFRVTFA